MICTFLRAVQYTEKLHRSSGKRLFLPHFVLSKSCLKTEPSVRRLHRQEKAVRPRCTLGGGAPKTIWTQGQSPQSDKDDSSKHVSVHSPRGEPAVSASQKGNREIRYWSVCQQTWQELPRPFYRNSVIKMGGKCTQIKGRTAQHSLEPENVGLQFPS